MNEKKSKIQLIIIIVELIILVGLSSYRVYEYVIKDKEEIKENESDNENVKKYWVTFDYGNNSIRSIEIKENEKIELPAEPIKEGYKFGGWLNNYTLIDENYIVKEDITLKINWIDEKIDSKIKILVWQINIRKEANETIEDIGDVLLDETYEVLEIIDSANYTWYKIKQGNIIGYVANRKGENWIEYSDNNGNSEKDNKVLYFYESSGQLYIDEVNNNKDYIGSYNCKSDDCYVERHIIFGQAYDFENKTVTLIENDKDFFLYNYKNDKIVSDIYESITKLDKYIIAMKNGKNVLLNYEGKEISKEYDKIVDYSNKGIPAVPQNYSIAKKIARYKENNKYGLLSLDSGKEITMTLYSNEELSIHNDNIVVKIDDLEYVMDEKGNITSKGYKKILSSNEEIIVLENDGMIDIIDYDGNTKIKDKVDMNGYQYLRVNYYECAGCFNIYFEDNKLIIYIPSDGGGIEYTYNIKTEELTKEEH